MSYPALASHVPARTRRRPSSARVLLQGAYYVPTVVALALSVACLRWLTAVRLLGRHAPSRTGYVLGGAIGMTWIIGLAVLAGFLSRSLLLGGVVFTVSLPLAAGVAWHSSQWARASFMSQQPRSLTLGTVPLCFFLARRPYVIPLAERMKTVAVTGPTGSGKTTSLKHWIVSDIHRGAGLAVIDPKDDLVDTILPHIPPWREQDVILLDVTDTERPLGFNPLGEVAAERRSLVASELVAVLRRYFSQSWGPRLEHVLTNVLLALLETPWPSTLLDIPKLLLDPSYTRVVLAHVSNPGVRQFFAVEFDQLLHRRGDAIEPILNKVNPWLTFPELRNIIGQGASSFTPRAIMDEGKILLVRIPQGALGEDISSLLGALLVAKIQLAAHSRVDTPPARRRPFFLYCDEFQNVVTSSFERILTEARAFNLGLICANQYPEQLSRELQLAIAKNAATSVECVSRRGHYRLQVRRLEDSASEHPPYLVVPPPPLPPGSRERAEQIRTLSRQRYGRDRDSVEQELLAHFGQPSENAMAASPKRQRRPATQRTVDVEEE